MIIFHQSKSYFWMIEVKKFKMSQVVFCGNMGGKCAFTSLQENEMSDLWTNDTSVHIRVV